MQRSNTKRIFAGILCATVVAGCADRDGNISPQEARAEAIGAQLDDRETIFDLFLGVDDPNRTVEVNKYIWTAAQEVLDFLPLETADPFSGVLVYGYGTPPGGGTAYRATVFVQDPALDARSLNVSLATRGGPVNAATAQAVEDAILTRARQLRLANDRL